MGADVRAEGFGRNQLHGAPEQVFQEEGKVDKGIEGLVSWHELHQHINVAPFPRLPASERAKYAQPAYTKGFNLFPMRLNQQQQVIQQEI